MKSMRFEVLAVVLVISFASAVVRAESAAEAYARGQALMSKGDFAAAVDALGAAAKAEPANREYAKRFTVAQRVVDFDKQLKVEQDPKKWELLARALRAFYLREKLNDQAIAISQAMHEKFNNTASAVALAETQLAIDKNDDALKTLQSISPDKTTAASQALLAIAYIETGKPEQAKQILSALKVPAETAPGAKLLVARAHGKAGNTTQAIDSLRSFFESVPPAELDKMKAQAKTLPEFASIASSADFAAVLNTASKVDQSKCTGGSDCSTCPIGAAACPSGDKDHADKQK